MSYTFEAPDPHAKGDVDFDFFDDPQGRQSPTNLGNSGKWKFDQGKEEREKQVKVKGKASKDSYNNDNIPSKSITTDTDSYSSDYTDEDSDHDFDKQSSSKEVKKIEAKIPTADTELSESSHSRKRKSHENDKRRKQSGSPSPKTESSETKNNSRPKTGHHKNRQRRRSYSSGSDRSKSSLSDSDYTTDSESDSDVTDVSSLNSPHTPVSSAGISRRSQSETNSGRKNSGRPPKTPVHKEVTFRRPPSATSSNGTHREPLIRPDSDNIDLKLLMQAVAEMEHGRMRQPPSEHTDPVFHKPRGHMSPPKKNMSFSNDGVRTIDMENQRLMQQIMKCSRQAKVTKKNLRTKKSVPVHVTGNKMSTSAINRHKEQQRIEKENFAMLQRLVMCRPTKQLARDKLMTDYEHHQLFGCSVADAHPLPKKKLSSKAPSPYMVPFDPQFQPADRNRKLSTGETRSEISDHSAATTGSSKMRPVSATTRGTRPLSAVSTKKQRPQSAKVQGFGTSPSSKQMAKPAWDDRW